MKPRVRVIYGFNRPGFEQRWRCQSFTGVGFGWSIEEAYYAWLRASARNHP